MSRPSTSQARELGRLARAARAFGGYRSGPLAASYPCPVNLTALAKAHSRNVAHRFDVVVAAGDDPTDLASIAVALSAHLAAAADAGQPCGQVHP